MVPTVLGAWIGVSTGIMQPSWAGMGLMVFLAGAFGFMFAIEKFKNSAAGVALLLGFTFFMGLMLSRLVGTVLGSGQRRQPGHDGLRWHRRRSSSAWPCCPAWSSATCPTMGKFLFIGAILLLVAGIANVFLQSSALMITLSVLAIGIFSAFILVRPQARLEDGEDELRHRHAGHLSEHLQRVPEPAGAASASSAASATDATGFHRSMARGPAGPLFHVWSKSRVEDRDDSPRGRCAETC
jgi:modulator of FtsH protease